MPFRLPDGILDRTHAFVNENDRAEYMKAFQASPGEDQMMSMALICADPGTPESFIWRNLSNMEMPPRVGYIQSEPTIMDALSISSPRARGRGNQIQGGVN
jgi:hypothetical protein